MSDKVADTNEAVQVDIQPPIRSDWFSWRLQLIPLAIPVIWAPVTTLTYILAVTSGHINPIFQYLSDTNTYSPEAGYFTQAVNVIAVLTLITFYLRYQQVYFIYSQANISLSPSTINLIHFLNDLSIPLAVFTAFGISLVGCFRVSEHLILHGVGAFLTYFFSMILIFQQTWMSMLTVPHLTTRKIVIFKLWLIVLMHLLFNLQHFFHFASSIQAKKLMYHKDRIFWSSDQPGFYCHVISAVFQWLLMYALAFSFSTFYTEIRMIHWIDGRLTFVDRVSPDTPANPVGLAFVGPEGYLGRLLKWTTDRMDFWK